MGAREIIGLKGVTFSYGKEELLRGVDLSVKEGEFIGIIGPNGGGKTTLLKLILGELEPDAGEIRVFGNAPKKGRRMLGYLSQFKDIDFDFPITVEEVVLLSRIGENLFKHYGSSDKEAAQKAMERMGISHLRGRKLNELSGGQKQRVFVARALAGNPKALVLDEPMANMDIHIQESFYRILKELNKDMPIVIVDHDLEMVSGYASRIICVNRCSAHTVKSHGIGKEKMREMYD
ncbi:ABC transporter ATP-binding protein [Candidatus Micrarchaeota archaeon]|nr:ABC transporter ATP-binding protein [Candidatus Micrarchaeota archaeon]